MFSYLNPADKRLAKFVKGVSATMNPRKGDTFGVDCEDGKFLQSLHKEDLQVLGIQDNVQKVRRESLYTVTIGNAEKWKEFLTKFKFGNAALDVSSQKNVTAPVLYPIQVTVFGYDYPQISQVLDNRIRIYPLQEIPVPDTVDALNMSEGERALDDALKLNMSEGEMAPDDTLNMSEGERALDDALKIVPDENEQTEIEIDQEKLVLEEAMQVAEFENELIHNNTYNRF